MQSIFGDTRTLDARCREQHALTEDVMMENAAMGLERAVLDVAHAANGPVNVVVLAGGGNNGADGYALARRLCGAEQVASVRVLQVAQPKTALCVRQAQQALSCGVAFCDAGQADFSRMSPVIVDCVFGAGFHGTLPESVAALLTRLNALDDARRIACDVPSGIDGDGRVCDGAFVADQTVCMGALKMCLFSDAAKEHAGTITVQNLGVSRAVFERGAEPCAFLLEPGDMRLPVRAAANVNKGSFGHAACVCGQKPGAAVIAGAAALRFGAGLVTLVSQGGSVRCGQSIRLDDDGMGSAEQVVPYDLMCAAEFPRNVTAVAVGMGLGQGDEALRPSLDFLRAHDDVACVVDADACYCQSLKAFLQHRSKSGRATVLTPHPKEYAALLAVCGLGSYSVGQVVEQRLSLVRRFCAEFPSVVLVLKGANVLVACKLPAEREARVFVNPFGTAALSKAGSGDVLTGLVCALLAQGYPALDAALSASLAHALASRRAMPNYALTPFALMRHVSELGAAAKQFCARDVVHL